MAGGGGGGEGEFGLQIAPMLDVMFVLLHAAEDHRTPVALVAELSGRV